MTLTSILVECPEEQTLSNDDERQNAGKRQGVVADFLQLAHKVSEEVEDANTVEELEHIELDGKHHAIDHIVNLVYTACFNAIRRANDAEHDQNDLQDQGQVDKNHQPLVVIFRRACVPLKAFFSVLIDLGYYVHSRSNCQ